MLQEAVQQRIQAPADSVASGAASATPVVPVRTHLRPHAPLIIMAAPIQEPYSLAAQCGSEVVAMTLAMSISLSGLANELLAQTKGSRMGWLSVALAFGLAFGFTIQMFGYLSALLNPATCMALLVIGKVGGPILQLVRCHAHQVPSCLPRGPLPSAHLLQLSFAEFVALSASEFLGAFIGACLVRP